MKKQTEYLELNQPKESLSVVPEEKRKQRTAVSAMEEQARKKKSKEVLKIKCMLNRPTRLPKIQQHLTKYYEIENPIVLERFQYIEAVNLPEQYQESLDFFNDERLAETMIIVVPDDLWVKGDQPSESSAENDIILFKQNYFEGSDNIAWMTHELAHCQKQKNDNQIWKWGFFK